jgi:PH (Pleckstrin Homology) domain-containing protein
MTTDLRIMTVVVLLVPIVLAVVGLGTPGLARLVLYGVLGFVAIIYLSVWFWWRPSRFEITARGLTIVWPLRALTIPAHEIREISILGRKDFYREYKYGLRVGAGGLWGGFGRLITAKGTLVMYISRTDAFVMVHRAGERPLMITPEQPERFVEELKAIVAAR